MCHPLEEVAVDIEQGFCFTSWNVTRPHHDTVQDGQVGLLVPAFQVAQAVTQVAADPGLVHGSVKLSLITWGWLHTAISAPCGASSPSGHPRPCAATSCCLICSLDLEEVANQCTSHNVYKNSTVTCTLYTVHVTVEFFFDQTSWNLSSNIK